jgi:uncharacterized protein YcbX
VAELLEIHTYPVKGEPGRDLQDAVVSLEGLEGDRRKKAPVHVVAAGESGPETRANLVVSLPPAELAEAIGTHLRVGDVDLAVTGTARDCAGVYADVAAPGRIRIGDPVTTGQGPA